MGAKQLFLISLFLLCISAIKGQGYYFHKITSPGEITTQTVNAITRDSLGYLWLGTYDGVIRYDGYSAKNLLNSTGEYGNGEKIDIRALHTTRTGEVLIGTRSHGLFHYNSKSGRFKNYLHDRHHDHSLSHNFVISICESKDGKVWIGTMKGLDLFDPESGETERVPLCEKKPSFVSGIQEDSGGNLWLYRGTHLCRYNPNTKEHKSFSLSLDEKYKDAYLLQGKLIIDDRDRIWLGNKLDGVSVFDIKSESLIQTPEEIKKNIKLVGALLQDSRGNIWIGSDGSGILKFDPDDGKSKIYRHEPDELSTISSNAVHALYETASGNIWVGLYPGGVDIIKKKKKRFRNFTHKGRKGKRLNSRSVISFDDAKNGKIWIGTDGGGINLFDPETGTFSYYTEENGGTCANVVKSLLHDTGNNLWSGTYRNGLCRTDLETGETILYSGNSAGTPESILRDNVWAIEEAGQKVYIGYLLSAVSIYDKKTDRFRHIFLDSLNKNLRDCDILSLMKDKDDRIWIGTETAGALCYEPETKKFSHFYYDQKRNSSLGSNEVRDIYQDSEGNIWMATRGAGLSLLTDFEKKSFKSFSKKNGLSSNNIAAILEDDNGGLWVSSDRGISFYSPEEGRFHNFSVEDGLQGSEFNIGAKLKTEDGFLLFGGVNGFNIFHPDSIELNKKIPPVLITGFRIFNEPVSPGVEYAGRKYLEQPIENVREIKLDYSDNIFTINFAALSYLFPWKSKYKYKLEGFDRMWTTTEASRRFATYTNLDPGEYMFKVHAANNDGFWSRKPAELKVVILPPWWKAWWFKSILIVTSLGGVFLLVYIRTKNVKKQNRRLKAEVEKQTKALRSANEDLLKKNELLEENNSEISRKSEQILEQQEKILLQKKELEQLNQTKDRLFSIIAHDLRNPVNSMVMLNDLLEKEYKSKGRIDDELFHNLNISSLRLKNLIINLLEWARSQSKAITIKPEEVNIFSLTEENIKLHEQLAFYKDIQLKIRVPRELYFIADRNMVNSIARNLVSNAIKYTRKGGEVLISACMSTDGKVSLQVKDNGIGIPEEKLQKLFQQDPPDSEKGTGQEAGTGLGLIISEEFTELNGGTISVDSSEGEGSTFTLLLPGVEKEVTENLSTPSSEGEVEQFAGSVNNEISIREEFRGNKILLVEDEEDYRKTLRIFLEDYFTIFEAPDSEEAIKVAEENFPDLIISDVHMPDVTGISFCELIKKKPLTSHIPVILLTGESSQNKRLQGLIAGADAYLIKPFDRDIFISTINNLLSTLHILKVKFSSTFDLSVSELAKSEGDHKLLSNAVSYVEENISDPALNGESLCRHLGVSKSVLYMKLKSITGQTVNEFIRTIRIKKSVGLLLKNSLSVAQIASEVGFNSASYFTKSFSEYFGMSPSQYMTKFRNKSAV